MSKIRVLTYIFDKYNLHIKIVTFADQEKLLKELVFSFAVFINPKTKNSQI